MLRGAKALLLDGRTAPVPRLWIRSAEIRGGGGASLGQWENNNNKITTGHEQSTKTHRYSDVASLIKTFSVHRILRPRGYKTFPMLNSAEHDFLNARK